MMGSFQWFVPDQVLFIKLDGRKSFKLNFIQNSYVHHIRMILQCIYSLLVVACKGIAGHEQVNGGYLFIYLSLNTFLTYNVEPVSLPDSSPSIR